MGKGRDTVHNPVMDTMVYGNPVWRWLVALGTFLLVLLVLKLIRDRGAGRLARLARRTATEVDDFLAEVLERRTGLITLLAVSVWAASLLLDLPVTVAERIRQGTALVLILQVAWWANHGIGFVLTRLFQGRTGEDPEVAAAYAAAQLLSRVGLWALTALVVLQQLGMNITALLAGLGVAGIAVGLALQNVLGDLFASLSIVLDKPFVVGDFIAVDNFSGTVEHIGIKTTRVRGVSGEEIVFSNADLLKSRVRNMKRMTERRVQFQLGVSYDTPYEKLIRIPAMVREIIEGHEHVRFERGHFKQFGDFALIFEFVYFVTDPDYLLYMDIQQSINLGIYRRFSEEGIQFAYPTRTIYLAGAMTAAGDPAAVPADMPGTARVAAREPARESAREAARGRAGDSPAEGGREARSRERGEA